MILYFFDQFGQSEALEDGGKRPGGNTAKSKIVFRAAFFSQFLFMKVCRITGLVPHGLLALFEVKHV